MNLKMRFAIVLSEVLLSQVLAVTISEINGNRFISAYQGKTYPMSRVSDSQKPIETLLAVDYSRFRQPRIRSHLCLWQ